MKKIKKNESGRSMVEMLGVLAVIGVLSVGGIYGYKMAMRKNSLNKHAYFISQMQLALTQIEETTQGAEYMEGETQEALINNKEVLKKSGFFPDEYFKSSNAYFYPVSGVDDGWDNNFPVSSYVLHLTEYDDFTHLGLYLSAGVNKDVVRKNCKDLLPVLTIPENAYMHIPGGGNIYSDATLDEKMTFCDELADANQTYFYINNLENLSI